MTKQTSAAVETGANQTTKPETLIFDPEGLAQAIEAAASAAEDDRDLRARVVTLLSDARDAGRVAIAAGIGARPRGARDATRAYTALTDALVMATWTVATQHLHRNETPTKGERLALMAVGGYGRGEMAPFSDVDLLFLTPHKITPWAESVIETMLYMLWDLKLKVGHSSRTIRDCVRLGAEDMTIRTAMLEHRPLGGDMALAAEFDTTLWRDLFKGTEREFIAAKLEERDSRHEKQGGQRYMVEPNVKEGKGGLRDLQSLYWIAKYVHHTDEHRRTGEPGRLQRGGIRHLLTPPKRFPVDGAHPPASGRQSCPLEQLTFDIARSRWPQPWATPTTGGRRAVEHGSCRTISATPPPWAI